ncbi:MAG: hypothetical protein MUE95_07880 [Cyclobacteriaceae bacterium]|nr:hypothetical protein [Cyclobacteriaceae bacterium]
MKRKRVLVTPLDWGLGHATRCIPIIRLLLEEHCDVLIAGAGDSLNLLKIEFPELYFISLPAYQPRYPRRGSMMVTLLRQAIHFVRVVRQEHRVLEGIVRENQIDYVISDNRYGCYSRKVPSVFITHQLTLLAPPQWGWLAFLANRVTGFYRNKFQHTWVPDWPGSLLTGKMSVDASKGIKFIGPLSRFRYLPGYSDQQTIDLLVLLSGPEPQRSMLEELIRKQLPPDGLGVVMVRGIPGNSQLRKENALEVYDHLPQQALEGLLSRAKLVLCRSGYSTIMDLMAMHKQAIFIPTPGQTEQEYFADRLLHAGVAWSMNQNTFDLKKALEESKKYTGFQEGISGSDLLLRHLRSFLRQE